MDRSGVSVGVLIIGSLYWDLSDTGGGGVRNVWTSMRRVTSAPPFATDDVRVLGDVPTRWSSPMVFRTGISAEPLPCPAHTACIAPMTSSKRPSACGWRRDPLAHLPVRCRPIGVASLLSRTRIALSQSICAKRGGPRYPVGRTTADRSRPRVGEPSSTRHPAS